MNVRCIPLGWNDLSVLNSIVYSYGMYLRTRLSSLERDRKIQVAYALQSRFMLLLELRQEESRLTITVEESAVLQDAMPFFVEMLGRIIPKSNERDEIIELIQCLRTHFAQLPCSPNGE